MWFHYSRKHISLYSFAVFVLSFVFVLLIFTPITRAEEFSFVGSVDVSVPLVDGKTQYGPVTVTLTDFTTSKTQSSEILAVTPIENISGSTQGIVNFKYSFGNLSKTDTYQVCIPTTSLCTPKIGPNEQNSYLNVGKTAINANISVSIQDLKDNPSIIPVTAAASTTTKTCGDVVTGVGWILCPVITGITALNDSMWSLVSGLLNVNPISQSSSIYTAWASIRNIANVVFVIIFLIMIFSQVSNIGITNYGIKKLFPRLIFGAILVNISFVVVQIVVDLANIIGSSLYGLLAGLAPNDFLAKAWTGLPGMILTAVSGTGLLVGGVSLIGGAAAAFWMLAPVALMGLLALLAAILTLIFRQAVIPILAILAPLAFVAYLLPNTESWFKKWRSLLTQMLMLYPLAAVVFGGSQLAARLIIGESPDWWNTVMGVIIMTLPLFSLPFLATKGGAITNAVGSALNNLAKKTQSPINKWTGSKADQARTAYDNRAVNGNLRRDAPRRAFLRRGVRLDEINKSQQSELARGKNAYAHEQISNNEVGAIQQTLSGLSGGRLGGRGIRTQMITGGTAGAAERLEARIQNEQRELDEKEIQNITALDNRNLMSSDNHLARLVDPTATANQRVASIRAIGESGGKGDLNNLAILSSRMNAADRREIQTVIGKKLGADNPAFGGPSIREIGEGTFNPDTSYARFIISRDFTADRFLSMHDSAKMGLLTHINNHGTAAERGALNAVRTQIEASDDLLSRTSGALMNEITNILGPPQPQPQPAPIPPQPSGLLDQYGNPLPPSQNNPQS